MEKGYQENLSIKNRSCEKKGLSFMEIIDIVDEYGNPTGDTVDREIAHARGIRHRTSHIWLLREREDGIQILLQKRSDIKDSNPGCYDISSAGHIPARVGWVSSALRELKEELGLDAKPSDLHYCGSRTIHMSGEFYGKKFIDSQVSNVYYLWRDVEPEELQLQVTEVSSVMWINLELCKDYVENHRFKNCISLEELNMLPDRRPHKKIAVLFPGVGYTCEKPLLRDSALLAKELGYEVAALDYGEKIHGFKGRNMADLEPFVYEALDRVLMQQRAIAWGSYERIVFISKSIGTVIACECESRLGMNVRHFLMTPIPLTLPWLAQADGQFVAGTADPYMNRELVEKMVQEHPQKLGMIFEGCNHSLMVPGDEAGNLRREQQVMDCLRRVLEA